MLDAYRLFFARVFSLLRFASTQDYACLKTEVSEMLAEMNGQLSSLSTTLFQTVQQNCLGAKGWETKLAKEQKERRKWLNKYIETQGNIRVFCRVRPLNSTEIANNDEDIVDVIDGENLTLKKGREIQSFNFNQVFGKHSTQREVFEEVIPFVHSAIDGYNVCVFAYGQTGSGKTFTMEGPPSDRGVNYRALGELFRMTKENQTSFTTQVKVSVVEIYNEQARDLLVSKGPNLDLRQGEQGVYIPDLTIVDVNSVQDVSDIMTNQAYVNRQVGVTQMNEHSSR